MKKLFLILFITLMVFGCGEQKKKENATKPALKTLVQKIAEAEKNINPNEPIDRTIALNLANMYQHFADSLPKDIKAPIYLLKASDYYSSVNMHSQKCHIYRNIIENYPNFKDVDMVQYLYASSLDSDFDERAEAKKQYQIYLDKYPNSTYVNDAKSRLESIDKLSFKELQEKIIKGELNTSNK